MELEVIARIGVPLLLAVVYLGAEHRHNGRARLNVRLHDVRARKVVEARRAAGAEVLLVHVVGEPGRPVNLGSSKEDPQAISGTPTLRTEAFTVGTDDGRTFSVPAGGRLRIEALPGARRNVLETVTTGSGVEQTYSFEVSPDQRFEILAIPPACAPQGAPFRSAARSGELLTAHEEVYVAGASLGALLQLPAASTEANLTLWPWIACSSPAIAALWTVPAIAEPHESHAGACAQDYAQFAWGAWVVIVFLLVQQRLWDAESPIGTSDEL